MGPEAGSTGFSADFGRTASDYALHRAGFPAQLGDALVARGIARPGARVVDLGTGTGSLARLFAERRCTVTGVDVAAPLLVDGGSVVIAHFDWVPIAGNVVAATEQIILRYTPTWPFADRAGLYPQWLVDLQTAGFTGIARAERDAARALPCGSAQRAASSVGGHRRPARVTNGSLAAERPEGEARASAHPCQIANSVAHTVSSVMETVAPSVSPV
jgi:hypothetical protein